MLISKFEGAFCFPVVVKADTTSDMKLVNLAFNSTSKMAFYSQKAGGIIGDKEGPYLFKNDLEVRSKLAFNQGALLWVYPAHNFGAGLMALGHKKVESLHINNDLRCLVRYHLVYHTDSFQVQAAFESLTEALELSKSNPKLKMRLYVTKLNPDELVGCALWRLPMTGMSIYTFRYGNSNYVSAADLPSSAVTQLSRMFGVSAFELIPREPVCALR